MSLDDTTPIEPTPRDPRRHPLAEDTENAQSGGGEEPNRTATAYLEDRARADREWGQRSQNLLAGGRSEEDEDDAHPEEEDEGEDPYGYDDDYEEAGTDLFETIWDLKVWIIGGVAALMLLVGGIMWLGGSEEPAPAGEAASNDGAPREAAPAPGEPAPHEGSVKDTGIVVEEPVVKDDGTYYLRAGEIAWKGKLENTETGEELTLEGPTASQFKRSVTLEQGSVTTGVFGRAEPNKPILHATFHRVTLGDSEETSGTYKAIDADAGVIVDGTYSDARDGQKVVRTYTEHAPGSSDYRSYRVSFEAPVGVPIPVLVGWEPPADAEIDEAA